MQNCKAQALKFLDESARTLRRSENGKGPLAIRALLRAQMVTSAHARVDRSACANCTNTHEHTHTLAHVCVYARAHTHARIQEHTHEREISRELSVFRLIALSLSISPSPPTSPLPFPTLLSPFSCTPYTSNTVHGVLLCMPYTYGWCPAVTTYFSNTSHA